MATFRRATARYHRIDAAIADGFVRILPCQANPDGEGALGIPYAKLDRFDAEIDLSEPEILMWVWRLTSEGVFSFWNDNVTCEFAE